jgi:hypothetical protein
MQHEALRRPWLHPALAVAGAVIFGCASVGLTGRAVEVAQQVAAADDPAQISDRALDYVFNESVAEHEIHSALASGDVDLAQSFLDLASERHVTVDAALADEVREAAAKARSVTNTAGRFAQGLWTGEPYDVASLAGTALGDLFVFGDIRDAAREGTRYLTGQPTDLWILGLAGVGIAITAGTYASLGVGAPTRVGVTLVKASRRAGRLNPALAVRVAREAVKLEKAGGLLDLVGDVGRIESKAGTQAALDSLQIAEEPRDVSRLARLSAAKGGKTRAIIKLLGRAAIILIVSGLDLANWLISAALAVLGFFASCKAAVERITLRHISRRKMRLAQAEMQALATPSSA